MQAAYTLVVIPPVSVILSRQAKDPCSLYREAKDPSLRSGWQWRRRL